MASSPHLPRTRLLDFIPPPSTIILQYRLTLPALPVAAFSNHLRQTYACPIATYCAGPLDLTNLQPGAFQVRPARSLIPLLKFRHLLTHLLKVRYRFCPCGTVDS